MCDVKVDVTFMAVDKYGQQHAVTSITNADPESVIKEILKQGGHVNHFIIHNVKDIT